MWKCKFTPLGFETTKDALSGHHGLSVNLPRWGLKLDKEYWYIFWVVRVNLPRWGLKQFEEINETFELLRCKFTPLGFETRVTSDSAVKTTV